MKRNLLMIMLLVMIGSCTKDEQEINKTGTLTQSFWAHKGLDILGNDVYLIYTFDSAGNISIDERNGSKTGKLIRSYHGNYLFVHPDLHLKIFYSAECPDCYNSFTASLNDEDETFTYTFYDMVSGKNRELKFIPF